ncbi:MAG: cupin domain-containing protein [Chloroflexota bacterium]
MTDEQSAPTVIDLPALARAATATGPIWSRTSEDLNVNLLLLDGSGVAEHVNDEVDVLLVGVAGEGIIEVDGAPHALPAGGALVIPKGARRAVRVTAGRFAYLTCHRRRGGLWPRGAKRP